MNKSEALEKTQRKFTNLIDGKILSGASVSRVINYYESLLSGEGLKVTSIGNIERNFLEEEIKEIEDDLMEDYV